MPTLPPIPAPASRVIPASGPLGTDFLACVVGLPAGAAPVDVKVAYANGGPTILNPTGSRVEPDGTYCLQFNSTRNMDPIFPGFGYSGAHTFSATAGGVSKQVDFQITTSRATGTSSCQPASGPRGTRFICTWFGLKPEVGATFVRSDGSSSGKLGVGTVVYADGSLVLAHPYDVQPGRYTLTATAGSDAIPVTFTVTP